MQAMLNMNIAQWIVDPEKDSENSGEIIESFVGQEILATYS